MNKNYDKPFNPPKKWRLSTFVICGVSLFYAFSNFSAEQYLATTAMIFLFSYELYIAYQRYQKVMILYKRDDLMGKLLQIMETPVIETHNDITLLNFVKPTDKIVSEIKYLESRI